eukprot:TRINITY_DN105212_c0_g1_i1.p1 TRINITY_DN105212_c0_g1~~TRINITY_DN105212_c0_g1_i1.p1  ORF type:complete len:419 (+),score=32.97 TRINITY_DN105212_c0_g1_i1:107-1258(+)
MGGCGAICNAKEEELYVVTVMFSPCGYEVRYKLFTEFKERMLKQGVKLIVVECIFPGQKYTVTDPENPLDIQVQAESVFWVKENLINIALKHLPADCKYVAWIDADISFENPNWVADTIKRLKKCYIVQMFDKSVWLDPNGKPEDTLRSFIYCYKHYENEFKQINKELANGNPKPEKPTTKKPLSRPKLVTTYDAMHRVISYEQPSKPVEPQETMKDKIAKDNTPQTRGQPGLCWAARREVLERLGGLLDFTITGAADKYMAYAFTGMLNMTAYPINGAYKKAIKKWQVMADELVRGSVDYVPGTVYHYWHGTRKNRQYYIRECMLRDFGFDPTTDLVRGKSGLYQFTGNKPEMYAKIMEYFVGRKEEMESQFHFVYNLNIAS